MQALKTVGFSTSPRDNFKLVMLRQGRQTPDRGAYLQNVTLFA